MSEEYEKEYGLVRSFHIDDGELEGRTHQQCFVLGYELALVDAQLERPEAFTRLVHSENIERIQSQCALLKRRCQINWFPMDPSESWAQLSVAAIEEPRK